MGDEDLKNKRIVLRLKFKWNCNPLERDLLLTGSDSLWKTALEDKEAQGFSGGQEASRWNLERTEHAWKTPDGTSHGNRQPASRAKINTIDIYFC